MRALRFFAVLYFSLFTMGLIAQTGVSDIPKIIVQGEHTLNVDADSYTALLDIEDLLNGYYEPSPSMQYRLWKEKQQKIIDQLGVKEFMTNPTYAGLKSFRGSGPFELTFPSKAQFELAQVKAQAASNEEVVVNLNVLQPIISEERRATLTSQAMDKAILQAKQKADRMAKTLGVLVGAPLIVEEIPSYSNYEFEPYNFFQSTGNSIAITAKVQIHFELKK